MLRQAYTAMALSCVISPGFIPSAQSHSWYPKSCCSDQDCEMVPPGAIHQTSTGFRIVYVSTRFGQIDEMVPSSQVRSSEDMNYHACWRSSNVTPKVICFLAPLNV